MPFWSAIPPLQAAPSFACSVASLNQSPGHQLSGCHGLRCGILTDYQLGWGRPSTWLARRACAPLRFITLVPMGDRRLDTPSTNGVFSKSCSFLRDFKNLYGIEKMYVVCGTIFSTSYDWIEPFLKLFFQENINSQDFLDGKIGYVQAF